MPRNTFGGGVWDERIPDGRPAITAGTGYDPYSALRIAKTAGQIPQPAQPQQQGIMGPGRLQQMAQGAAFGAAGSQGGLPGIFASAIANAAVTYAQHKRQQSALDGFIDHGVATSEYSKGGQIQPKILKRPRESKVHVAEIPQGLNTKARVSAPARVTPQAAKPFRASQTGQFAKGGLVRGMGIAVRGKTFGGNK